MYIQIYTYTRTHLPFRTHCHLNKLKKNKTKKQKTTSCYKMDDGGFSSSWEFRDIHRKRPTGVYVSFAAFGQYSQLGQVV